MEKTYRVRTVMELEVKATSKEEAKVKAYQHMIFDLKDWIPITPFDVPSE